MSSDTIRAAEIQARGNIIGGIIVGVLSGAPALLVAMIAAGWFTFKPSGTPATSADASHFLIAKSDAIAIGVSLAICILVLLMRKQIQKWLFWYEVYKLFP